MPRYRIFFIAVSALHVSVGLPPIIRSSKFKTVHTPDAVCTVLNFELLMMGGEIAQNM
jgi:hypothetical protein